MELSALKEVMSRLVRERQALKEGEDILVALESLVQAESDLNKNIAILKKQRASLQEQAEKVNDVINQGKEAAKEAVKKAASQAEAITAKATDDATEIVKQANIMASKIASEVDGLASAKMAALDEMDALRAMVLSLQADVALLEKVKADARKALGV